jgi:anti-sigma factor RsiW
MACDQWKEKLDTYLDGELPENEDRVLREHLRACSACATDALDRMQMKRAVKAAGLRFQPNPAFRARVERSIAAPHPRRSWNWLTVTAFATAAVVLVAFAATYLQTRSRDRDLVSELVDLHVATLASTNPVDVVSTDRHTVKPWFEGKLPFTFDLPELQGTPFTLIGGRTAFLHQSPGAELIFRIRQHNLSVFIFEERAVNANCGGNSQTSHLNFHLDSWSKNGLCYFVVGDVNQDDLEKLAFLMKS